MLPRMSPLCKIAAPQVTFVKFLKGQGTPLLPPDAFWTLGSGFVQKPQLVVIYLCSEKPQSSTPALQLWSFRVVLECRIHCAPLLFCCEHNLPVLLPNSPATPGLSSYLTLSSSLSPCVPLKGPAFIPFILCGAIQIDALIRPLLIKCSLAFPLMEGKWEGKRVKFPYFQVIKLDVYLTTL